MTTLSPDTKSANLTVQMYEYQEPSTLELVTQNVAHAPAHAGAFFKEVHRDIKVLPRDLTKVLEIGERNGIRFRRVESPS